MFKRKRKKEETKYAEFLVAVSEYIKEAKEMGMSDSQIRKKFEEKKYPEWVIKYAFDMNERGLDNMVKKKKEEYEDEDEFEDEDEIDEEDEEDEEPTKKTKKTKPVKKETTELSSDDIKNTLINHEQRITNIEAWIQRIRSQ